MTRSSSLVINQDPVKFGKVLVNFLPLLNLQLLGFGGRACWPRRAVTGPTHLVANRRSGPIFSQVWSDSRSASNPGRHEGPLPHRRWHASTMRNSISGNVRSSLVISGNLAHAPSGALPTAQTCDGTVLPPIHDDAQRVYKQFEINNLQHYTAAKLCRLLSYSGLFQIHFASRR
jgi:hypothetical protein